jgi:hypothetical protein
MYSRGLITHIIGSKQGANILTATASRVGGQRPALSGLRAALHRARTGGRPWTGSRACPGRTSRGWGTRGAATTWSTRSAPRVLVNTHTQTNTHTRQLLLQERGRLNVLQSAQWLQQLQSARQEVTTVLYVCVCVCVCVPCTG